MYRFIFGIVYLQSTIEMRDVQQTGKSMAYYCYCWQRAKQQLVFMKLDFVFNG